MSSGGSEIGEWPDGEYTIDHNGEGMYTITAESESIQFIPNDPTLFAAGLNGGVTPAPETSPDDAQSAAAMTTRVFTDTGGEGPEPKAVTMAIFYGVATLTALLGLWALASLLIG
ncbi:MAG: hypothetical protein U9N56_00765 [Actinomycetota bacterium]|nr:hypothetical protein [Actinomycetota bacterium]